MTAVALSRSASRNEKGRRSPRNRLKIQGRKNAAADGVPFDTRSGKRAGSNPQTDQDNFGFRMTLKRDIKVPVPMRLLCDSSGLTIFCIFC